MKNGRGPSICFSLPVWKRSTASRNAAGRPSGRISRASRTSNIEHPTSNLEEGSRQGLAGRGAGIISVASGFESHAVDRQVPCTTCQVFRFQVFPFQVFPFEVFWSSATTWRFTIAHGKALGKNELNELSPERTPRALLSCAQRKGNLVADKGKKRNRAATRFTQIQIYWRWVSHRRTRPPLFLSPKAIRPSRRGRLASRHRQGRSKFDCSWKPVGVNELARDANNR